jgi:solute:Na+ symporter, SSS family
MAWLIFWIVVYLLIILYFSLRHIKTTDVEAYLVNNRQTGVLPLVFTTLATFVGGGTSIGLMAMGYESGFAAVGIGIAYVIGFFILMRYAGKINSYGREHKIYSLPGYLNHSYAGSHNNSFTRRFSALVSGVNIFIFFFLLAAQFVAMASLLKFSFSIDYIPAAVISCLIVIVYTAIAGLSGVIITDMIQFVVIIIMIILIFIPGIWIDTDGLDRISDLPAEMLNGTFYGIAFLVALPLFLAPSVMVRLDIWQRMLAARNPQTARRVSLLSGLGMLPFYIIFPLVGMAVKLAITSTADPRDITYLFLEKHSTPFILGFAIVGMLSALMSSGDSFLNIISISAIKDFAGWKKGTDTHRDHSRIRMVSVVFGVIALLMSLVFPKIVDLMVVGLGTIVIFVPATFLALHRQHVKQYRMVAFWSILAGFVANTSFFVIGIVSPTTFEAKSAFIMGFIASLIAMLAGMVIIKSRQKGIAKKAE